MKKILLFLILAMNFSVFAQSDFYQTCLSRKDVAKVAYFKNQKVDDERVDITLVQAKDSAAFGKILDEYGIPFSKDSKTEGLTICIRNNDDPKLEQPQKNGKVSLKNACLIGASETELTIYVFHNLRNEDRLHTIIRYITNEKNRKK